MKTKRSKYRNKKIVIDGIKFDSIKEGERYKKLKLLESIGEISNLKLQVKFVLFPSQRIDGKLVEREAPYYADFVYNKDGKQVVEDSKGFKTREYILKRKAMLYLHGIRIYET